MFIERIHDEHTFKQIYHEILYPNFGILPDELESLDFFINHLKHKDFLFVYAAFDHKNDIIGCICFEQYPKSQCTLMTYIAVKPKYQKHGIASTLFNHALQQCKDQKAVFMEANKDTVQDNDVMSPSLRRKLASNIGFRFLNLPYVQPQLSQSHSKCYDLYLAIHQNYIIDKDTIALWLQEFYNKDDQDLQNMLDFLQNKNLNVLEFRNI